MNPWDILWPLLGWIAIVTALLLAILFVVVVILGVIGTIVNATRARRERAAMDRLRRRAAMLSHPAGKAVPRG